MAQYRKDQLESNYYYHIFSRSIAKYTVFNDGEDYSRFIEIFELYRYKDFNYQYSKFTRLDPVTQSKIIGSLQAENDVFVEIIAFCLMPTHIHFLLKQVSDQGISKFMSNILNCYSRYFNIKHKRIGPLWSGRFKSVLINTDEQLLHLTRYIHLNPTSEELVVKPGDWHNSSYNDYIDISNSTLIQYSNLFSISPKEYKSFVMNHKDYQKELSKIKSLIIEDYTG
ncbi:MAG: transposase [Candidatus Berkelbacteria bacterium]|nr:transposase [Candidatus Berkelbacteria bacterium]